MHSEMPFFECIL